MPGIADVLAFGANAISQGIECDSPLPVVSQICEIYKKIRSAFGTTGNDDGETSGQNSDSLLPIFG